MITTPQLMQKYGTPNETGVNYLVTIPLPYPMRLSWDKSKIITRLRCHKLVANQLSAIFKDILDFYGLEHIQRLGIDLYGGCFNFRKMRGGSDWSRHSWGVAIDLDPERNQLKQTSKNGHLLDAFLIGTGLGAGNLADKYLKTNIVRSHNQNSRVPFSFKY